MDTNVSNFENIKAYWLTNPIEVSMTSNVKNTWRAHNVSGYHPHVRSHSCVHYKGSLYCFGGRTAHSSGYALSPHLYKIDLHTFKSSEVITNGDTKPEPRLAHTAVVWKNYMFIFGGKKSTNTDVCELYRFDFETNQWMFIRTNDTVPQSYHSAVIFKNSMLVYGDFDKRVHEYDILKNKWTPIMGENAPLTRYEHSATMYKNSMYVFGGMVKGVSHTNDIWEFDCITHKWQKIVINGDCPIARKSHTAITIGDSMLMFGGYSNTARDLNDLWEFNYQTQKWRKIINCGMSPCKRNYHMAVAVNNSMWISCGEGEVGKATILNDLYEFKFESIVTIIPKLFKLLEKEVLCDLYLECKNY